MIVDFHTHLNWYEDSKALQSQLQNFHGIIIAASVDAESFRRNQQIAQVNNNENLTIIPTFGIHPERVLQAPKDLSIYEELCDSSPIIGEIGMDFCWYKEASPAAQERVFRYFLEHCNKTGKYCVIHTKDAEKEICEILKDYPNAKPIIHWYDGPEDIYQEFIKRGYYQTFGCELIRSKHIQKLLQQTPLELILAETDNPTAEPWLGGNDNSVQLINRIYNDIATVLGKPIEVIEKQIYENVYKIGLYP